MKTTPAEHKPTANDWIRQADVAFNRLTNEVIADLISRILGWAEQWRVTGDVTAEPPA